MASVPFTLVFVTPVSTVNTKLLMIGEVLLHRLTSQFRILKRNAWSVRGFYFHAVNSRHLPFQIVYHSTSTFITYFVSQGVAHELIAPQFLAPLPERPTDNSIEIAVGFMPDVGAFLQEHSTKVNVTVTGFKLFCAVLNEGNIGHCLLYIIELFMQVRKDRDKDKPISPEGLGLVEEEQIRHEM